MNRNPYLILEVSSYESPEAIKKAYRLLVMKHHPDRGGCAENFQEISWAYKILSDKEQRRYYDKYGCTEDEQETVSDSAENELNKIFEGIKTGDPRVVLGKDEYWSKCTECDGTGELEKEVGFFISKIDCKTCDGFGQVKKILVIKDLKRNDGVEFVSALNYIFNPNGKVL